MCVCVCVCIGRGGGGGRALSAGERRGRGRAQRGGHAGPHTRAHDRRRVRYRYDGMSDPMRAPIRHRHIPMRARARAAVWLKRMSGIVRSCRYAFPYAVIYAGMQSRVRSYTSVCIEVCGDMQIKMRAPMVICVSECARNVGMHSRMRSCAYPNARTNGHTRIRMLRRICARWCAWMRRWRA